MPSSKKLIAPARLNIGDKVGIVAPAGPVEKDQLERGMRVIVKMGFRPVLCKCLFERDGFLAGSDEERAADLMAMFADPEVKGIFCARGGYGVNRILHLLDSKVIRNNPKIVVGSSDLTLLLQYLNQKFSMVTFHGPMIAGSFGRNPMKESQKQFWEILSGQKKAKKLSAPKARVIRSGKASGELTGGCLTLLCRSLKTPFEIKTKGKILLIEDVNEPAYRIDGMLWQLKQAGKFKEVKAVIFGEMVNCKFNSGQKGSLDDLIRDIFKDDPFPVVTNCPIGHGNEMWTLPLGVQATLNTKSKSLTLESCGVE